MPTLTRLLLVLALLAAAVFSAMWALVAFVRPETVPITVSVPIPALQDKRPVAVPPAGTPDTLAEPQTAPAGPAPVEGLR
jgi:hypothetical protein